MREAATIQGLIDDGTIERALCKGSRSRHAIEALQTTLHWLGFDRALKWDRYGADGDYGAATTAAVADFARRNGSRSGGDRVTAPLARKILARYEALDELKQLKADVDRGKTEALYRRGSRDGLRVRALQTLLNELGLGAELRWSTFGADGDYGGSTARAVAAFATRSGVSADGTKLTLPLAERIVAELSPFYGPGWSEPGSDPGPSAATLRISPYVDARGRAGVEVSDGALKVRLLRHKLGLITYGDRKPLDFVRSHQAEIRRLGVTASEIALMTAVSENEGNLDAVNTWDNAFLSFGIFQWTAGTGSAKGELAGLLARIRDADGDLFQKHYGQHGLDVAGVGAGYVTGYLSLFGSALRKADAKEQLREPLWAFRFWRSGRDPAIQALQIKHALSRLDRFYTVEGQRVDGHFISELVTSEDGVGLLLDNHVNRPGYVRGCLQKALRSTGLTRPERWGDGEEKALIDAYLKIRETYGATPMTHAATRAETTRKYVTNGTISARRGSFRRSGT